MLGYQHNYFMIIHIRLRKQKNDVSSSPNPISDSFMVYFYYMMKYGFYVKV